MRIFFGITQLLLGQEMRLMDRQSNESCVLIYLDFKESENDTVMLLCLSYRIVK